MSRLAACVVLAGIAAGDVDAQSVPFATPPPYRAASLGDIMGTIQTRHIKLWSAIKSKNWPLVDYEVRQTRDSLVRAATLYLAIPIELIDGANAPLVTLQEAVKAKDARAAKQAYGSLTAACNACHQAAQIEFIRIRTPTTSLFSNQKF